MLIAYYYCMPKKISETELVKRDQKIMDSLPTWLEVVPNISRFEMKELIKFGKKYGKVAMVKRARSFIEGRQAVSKDDLQSFKTKTDFLVSMRSIRRTSAGKSVKSETQKSKLKKTSAIARGFSKRVEPLVRSMLTLAFTSKVVYRYLSQDELAQLTGINDSPDNQNLMKVIIERRSGSTISVLMREIQDEVESDFVRMWASNLKDGIAFGKNPEFAKKYESLLRNEKLSELTSTLMRGNH